MSNSDGGIFGRHHGLYQLMSEALLTSTLRGNISSKLLSKANVGVNNPLIYVYMDIILTSMTCLGLTLVSRLYARLYDGDTREARSYIVIETDRHFCVIAGGKVQCSRTHVVSRTLVNCTMLAPLCWSARSCL